ncbi:MAG: type I DNA topoisomerase [Spirochaetes bacterium]|nr:type I DNA topoisomerase [Spirochaetota bacterium]
MKKKKILVIVESPAKAKTINKYLGSNFIVDSSKGHLIDLPKSRLAVDVDNNFQPEYKIIKGRASILKELKKKAGAAKSVLLAADPDREGEAISWHLANALKEVNPDIKRIIFNEITKDAIRESVDHPVEIDMNKVNSQQARRILDRLVGYKISPILWKKVKAGLSAGRVQSVALKIICDREDEISIFVPQEYWTIEVEFIKDKEVFSTNLVKINGEKFEINNKEEADRVSSLLHDSKFHVAEIIEKERKRNPLPPYITSKLQQDGLNRLGYSAQRTMRIAQQLYEGIDITGEGPAGLITYMRTDSTRIGNSALQQVREYIKEEFGDQYLPEEPNVYKSKKNVQDAHEAIRPTSVARTPESIKENLTPDQYKLYSLIYNRFLASQMTPGLLMMTTVMITGINKDENFELHLNYSKYKFDGFTRVYSYSGKEANNNIPHLDKDEKLQFHEMKTEQHFTQPPARYSDASIIKVLEESGIGRPSTYAPIISTLEWRYYIQREGRQLIPTELGMLISKLLVKNFPHIMNIDFTVEIEEKLDKIADAEIEWKDMLKDFYPPFMENVEKAMINIEEIDDYKKGLPTDEVCDKINPETGEKCGAPMVKKLGRYGYFLACSRFPDCRNAKPLPIADCPVPGCDGQIIGRQSKRKRKFFVCSKEDCNYILWSKPLKDKCPKCRYYLIYARKDKQTIKKCSNPECDYWKLSEEDQKVHV